MISIAFIINNLNIGGAEKLLIDKINNWPKTYQIHLILLQKNNILLNDLRKDIIIHNEFPDNKIAIVLSMLNIYRKHKIVYSISHLERPNKLNLFATLFAATKPIVVLHSINMYKKNSIKEFITKSILSVMANKIVAISPAVKNYLTKGLGVADNNVVLIENGIDFNRITKDKMPQKTKANSFFTLGRLVNAKGYGFMIKALNNEDLLKLDWHLTLIGGGPLFSDFISLIDKENLTDRITLLGGKINPFQHIEQGSIVLMPSRREGLPIALLEVMSVGIPVLSSNIEPLAMVKSNKNGIKFNVEDVASFRIAFKNALLMGDDEYIKLSKGAIDSVKNYSIGTCVNSYLKLIEKQ